MDALLDECHKAKNFDAGAETGSKVAACVIELQRRCPDARVVYCSPPASARLATWRTCRGWVSGARAPRSATRIRSSRR